MTWRDIIPLLGVLLGGFIVAGSNYLLERIRWRREDAARRRAEERELRRAARIVLEELSQLARLVKRVAQTGRYWPKESPDVGGWEKYQDALAADVSDETWRGLTMAYDGIIQFNESSAKGRTEANVGQVGFSSAGLRLAFVAIHRAMSSLEKELPGPKAGVFHYTGYASIDEMWPEGCDPV